MSRSTIHAPEVNFATARTMSTTKVVTAPRPFTNADQCHPGSRLRHQWTTMPDWESVNDMNTPIA